MTILELEEWVRRELDAAGFRFDAPDPRVAWAVFVRCLEQPLDHDWGALVLVSDAIDSWGDMGQALELTIARQATSDMADNWYLTFRFMTPLTGELAALGRGGVAQAPGDGTFLATGEFVARVEADPVLGRALTDPGPWRCTLEAEDQSD